MPTNKEIFIDYLGQTSPTPLMLEIEKAEGVKLYGPDGKNYIDLISGVSVSNTGHRHPEVINAIKRQV
jgi:putrescine aminotransferase